MAIVRNRTQHFTIVESVATSDTNLSLKALGLLCKMLSLPDGWEFSEKGLAAIMPKDGITAIRSGLKELEQAGYLHRSQVREGGRFREWEWEVSNTPTAVSPKSGFPSSVFTSNISFNNKSLSNPSQNPPQIQLGEPSATVAVEESLDLPNQPEKTPIADTGDGHESRKEAAQ